MLNKKSRFYKYCILPSFAVFILAGFLLTFSVNINAASAQSYFPMVINENNTITDSDLNAFNNVFGLSDYYWFIGNVPNSTNFYFFRFKKSSSGTIYATINDNKFSFVISGSLQNFMSAIRPASGSNISSSNSGFVFSNLESSLYNTSISYWSNFPIFTDSTEDHPVLLLEAPITVPDVGHAQDPMGNIPSFVPPIGMHPQSAPSAPSYTFPTLATRPTWDSNHPFDSLFDIVQWGFGFSYDLLTGILQNIIDWATFFGNLIVWIYEQIWNYFTFFIDWLYRIFEYLFSPIYNFLNALFHDGDDVLSISDLLYEFMTRFDSFSSSIFQDTWFTSYWNNFSNELLDGLQYFSKIALFFGNLVALGTVNGEFAVGTLVNNLFLPNPAEVAYILYSNDEFDVFSTTTTILQAFPILFNQLISVTPSATIHIPSLIYHGQQIGDFDVDFSWYAVYKIYVDVILNAFLIIGYLYWLFITFGSHLRGHFIDYEPNNPDSNARLFKG